MPFLPHMLPTRYLVAVADEEISPETARLLLRRYPGMDGFPEVLCMAADIERCSRTLPG